MNQQSRRPSTFFPALDPEYIRIEEDETQDQVQRSQSTEPPQLHNVAMGDPLKRRSDGSFSKANVLNSLVPIHHAQWGGYTPKEIPPKKSTKRSSSSSSSPASSTVTNARTSRGSGGASSFLSFFSTTSSTRTAKP